MYMKSYSPHCFWFAVKLVVQYGFRAEYLLNKDHFVLDAKNSSCHTTDLHLFFIHTYVSRALEKGHVCLYNIINIKG